MDRANNPRIASDDASVTPFGNVRMMFDCGEDGLILAEKGLKFAQLQLPAPQGKLIQVSSTAGNINVTKVGFDAAHRTHIRLTKANKADELHIRIPIGVRFYEVDVPSDLSAADFQQAFFFYAGDGYNVYPLFLPLGVDSNQLVKELV